MMFKFRCILRYTKVCLKTSQVLTIVTYKITDVTYLEILRYAIRMHSKYECCTKWVLNILYSIHTKLLSRVYG